MKKMISALIISMVFLQGCSLGDSESEMVEWGEYSESQVMRLKDNGIKFEVKNERIYIDEQDLNKASSCCT